MKISMEHKLNISDKDYSLMDVNVFLPLDRNTFLLIISICQMIENTANKFPNWNTNKPSGSKHQSFFLD